MAGESYNREPVGKIINRGEPLLIREKVLTASAKAGMLVDVDGNDYKAKPAAGTLNPTGWISFEHTGYEHRPDNYETAFASGDVVAIASGGNFVIYALASGGDSGLTINEGDYLASNDDGTLTKATDASTAVAIAVESKTLEASAVARIHVKSLI